MMSTKKKQNKLQNLYITCLITNILLILSSTPVKCQTISDTITIGSYDRVIFTELMKECINDSVIIDSIFSQRERWRRDNAPKTIVVTLYFNKKRNLRKVCVKDYTKTIPIYAKRIFQKKVKERKYVIKDNILADFQKANPHNKEFIWQIRIFPYRDNYKIMYKNWMEDRELYY